MSNYLIQNIIQQLVDVQEGKPWIGSSYASKLNEVDENKFFTRPLPDLHSIAEILSHLTLWRKETILKIQTGTGSKTDDCPENWRANEELRQEGWQSIRSEYEKTLFELIELLKSKNDAFLDETYYDTDFKGRFTYSFVINGMLHHDIYHLGQIGIIIKYLNQNNIG